MKRLVLISLFFLVVIAAGLFLKKSFFSKDQRLLDIEQEVRELREKKALLKKAIEDSEKRSFVEKEAKERLNMVYPGETVVILPDDAALEDEKQENNSDESKKSFWKKLLEKIF